MENNNLFLLSFIFMFKGHISLGIIRCIDMKEDEIAKVFNLMCDTTNLSLPILKLKY